MSKSKKKIVLRERRQTQKITHYMIPFTQQNLPTVTDRRTGFLGLGNGLQSRNLW